MRFSKTLYRAAAAALLITVAGAVPLHAETHPLNYLGRWLSIGWSPGYHAYNGCDCEGAPNCPHCQPAPAVREELFSGQYIDRLIRSAQQPPGPKRLPPVR
jgi:hypothetical protein